MTTYPGCTYIAGLMNTQTRHPCAGQVRPGAILIGPDDTAHTITLVEGYAPSQYGGETWALATASDGWRVALRPCDGPCCSGRRFWA